jgi:hypothetical protein
LWKLKTALHRRADSTSKVPVIPIQPKAANSAL